MDLGLRDAKVLVTAASRGLGAATALQFSREGAQVVISSRGIDTLQTTADHIQQATGNRVIALAADLNDLAEAEALVRRAAEALGGLDVLVTNTGGPPAGTFDDLNIAQWQEAANSLILSTVTLIRSALPHLRRSSRAAVLTITSVSVKQPVANLTLSNALRPAVMGLTKTLALELGAEGIRFNSILPGYTNTERVEEVLQARAGRNRTSAEEEARRMAADLPLGRIGQPEEFANAAVFLCSPAAAFITGVALPVDGGTIRATL